MKNLHTRLPKNWSMLKMELVFILLFGLMLAQKISGNESRESFSVYFNEQEMPEPIKDEPERHTTEFGLEYVLGSEELLHPELSNGNFQEKTREIVAIGTPIPPVTDYMAAESVMMAEHIEERTQTLQPTVSPSVLQQQVLLPTKTPEHIATSGSHFVSMFSPACYPALKDIIGKKYLKEDLLQLEYLKDTFYIVNSTTKMTKAEFDVDYFLNADLSIKKTKEPQILIYHTHASEGFIDSKSGITEDSVVGVGELLAQYLREKYGYQVLHDTTVFDKKNGKDNRSSAYNDALPYLEELLAKYPSIEVVIDLHRDAGTKRVTTIDGKQVAKVMLFNGLCRNTQGKLEYLPNKNLADNLAFSFQMKLIGDEMYPGLMHRIFLKDYRYNMHLVKRYLLIELGTNQNTVEEAKNAMEPLADVLAQVLGGEN